VDIGVVEPQFQFKRRPLAFKKFQGIGGAGPAADVQKKFFHNLPFPNIHFCPPAGVGAGTAGNARPAASQQKRQKHQDYDFTHFLRPPFKKFPLSPKKL
jgi:hypothetical protein